jgi:arylsulfatase A-like enzyme
VVEEIDFGIGEILKVLKEEGLEENTLVIFTSDNGPWLAYAQHGGSAGLLREGKGTTWEGGMREPTLFYWPGKIQPAVVTGIGSTLDLFATITGVAGAKLPQDRVMDSHDLSPALFQGKSSPRELMFYYRGTRMFAVRKGPYKAHFMTMSAYKKDNQYTEHDPPLLYHLGKDPGEKYEISEKYPEIIEDILREVRKHEEGLVRGEDQLVKRIEM